MRKLLPIIISSTLYAFSSASWADTLASIYDQAKSNDPTLASSAATRDAAFESINEFKSYTLPQIDLSGGLNKNISSEELRESQVLSAGINATHPLYERSSWITLTITEKTARQVDASYAAAQQDLIIRVADAYFNVLRAQDNLEFVKAEKTAVGRQLEQTKQRFEVGLSAITDVHDAQAQYDAVLADEVLAQNELNNSYEGLTEITSNDHSDLYVLNTQRFSATRQDSPSNVLLKEAESKNLSLLSARISKDIAKESITLAQAGKSPTVLLTGGYNYGDDMDNETMDAYTDLSIGVNVSMPLYTGGRIDSEVKQAQFEYIAASQDLEATHRGVVKNVRAFSNNINAAIGALKAYEQSVVSAKSALQATEAGFDVGTRTIVDILDATRRLYDANSKLSNARYDYILSVLQLKQATGSLSEQDILDINAGLTAVK
ncbi:outer membrane channel protein TolC [Vibrio sp.]|nr:outer membrane channel protein TolC [Vibrio sp.]